LLDQLGIQPNTAIFSIRKFDRSLRGIYLKESARMLDGDIEWDESDANIRFICVSAKMAINPLYQEQDMPG